MQNWKSDIFGNNTSIDKYEPGANIISNTKFQYTSALIKHIPPNFPENIVLNNIKNNYNSVINIKRFIKNGNILNTIKIDFSNNDECLDFINNGFIIGNQFFPCEKFVLLKTPIRCYNCSQFGHIDKTCPNNFSKCSKCSGEHKKSECTSEIIKCPNCNGNHEASNQNCPIFLEQTKKLNFL